MIENKWWGHLKFSIRLFAVDYNRRFNRHRLAMQMAVESRLEGAVHQGSQDRIMLRSTPI